MLDLASAILDRKNLDQEVQDLILPGFVVPAHFKLVGFCRTGNTDGVPPPSNADADPSGGRARFRGRERDAADRDLVPVWRHTPPGGHETQGMVRT